MTDYDDGFYGAYMDNADLGAEESDLSDYDDDDDDDDESDEDEYSYPVPRVKEVIGVISDDEGNEDMLVV